MIDTKALRQKILDLAIRGKLVPQDPDDEPASVLLERIRQQKQQMVKAGKLKPKDIKDDSVIFVGEDNLHYEKFADGSVKCIEDEIPFDLPEGWAWCRLSMVGTTSIGLTYKPTEVKETGTIVLRSCNIKNGKIDFADLVRVQADIRENQYIYENDILICARNGSQSLVGKCAIMQDLPEAASFGAFMAVFRSICNQYVYYYFNTALFRSSFSNDDSKQINQVTQAILRDTLIPLPPFAEQTRIVAKLHEILSLADFINDGTEQIEMIITKAKSKILDLAIRGQLVPQDPDDEPASVLLERIRAEKEELIKQGKLKRDKKESVIFRGEDNSYYLRTGELVESLEDWDFEELPDSWSVCCLGELCDYGNCTNIDTADIADSAWILDLEDIEKDSGVVLQKVRQGERNAGSTKHRFHKGQVLYSKLRPYLNKVVLADEDGYCTSEILPLEFERNILPQYARYFLMSPAFLRYANKCSYGVKMPRLGTADGKKAIISVPPVKEQKRIIMAIELAFAQLASITENLA